jgi:hypothetical protein
MHQLELFRDLPIPQPAIPTSPSRTYDTCGDYTAAALLALLDRYALDYPDHDLYGNIEAILRDYVRLAGRN